MPAVVKHTKEAFYWENIFQLVKQHYYWLFPNVSLLLETACLRRCCRIQHISTASKRWKRKRRVKLLPVESQKTLSTLNADDSIYIS